MMTSKSDSSKSSLQPDPDWIRIYRFPGIVQLRAFSRFKIWLTAFNVGLAPFVVSAYQPGHLEADFAVGSMLGATLATATLYAFSYFSRHLIGIVSVHAKDEKQLRIGRLTFWGQRVNDFVERSDIIPIGDLGENPRDVFLRVYRYSEPKRPYFLVLRFGGVDQSDQFRSIFGTK